MKLSDQLADLNVERYAAWQLPQPDEQVYPALYHFAGAVFQALDARTLESGARQRLHRGLRILSGLYGLLRPGDRIQSYRLEMGTRLKLPDGVGLYHFWADTITQLLMKDVKNAKAGAVVNLASQEYAKVIDHTALPVPMVTPTFWERQAKNNNQLKQIGVHAKAARGAMTAVDL